MNNDAQNVPQPDLVEKKIKERLWTRGFVALLITQFFVSFNDNFFRWLIVPIGKCSLGWSDNPARILALGGVIFLAPFLLFTPYAGYFTDRFSRQRVMIACKIVEVVVILFGIAAILSHSVPFMLTVLFFLGAQSAFFSPAKYSALPMIVPTSRISEANGLYSATTLIACVGGQILGGFLFDLTTLFDDAHHAIVGSGGTVHWGIWAGALLFVAISGLISSLFVPYLKPAAPTMKFPFNPFFRLWNDFGLLFRSRIVWGAALGSAFFWGIGALGQSNIDYFGTGYLGVSQTHAMFLMGILVLGLTLGALFAGIISRGRIAMGLVPLGAFAIILFAFLLAMTPSGQPGTGIYTFPVLYGAAGLFLMGGSSEVFDIPLLAVLQTKSPSECRGRILAAYNFISFASMAGAIIFWGLLTDKESLGLSAVAVWGVCSLITVPVFIISMIYIGIPIISSWMKKGGRSE